MQDGLLKMHIDSQIEMAKDKQSNHLETENFWTGLKLWISSVEQRLKELEDEGFKIKKRGGVVYDQRETNHKN